MLKYISKKFDRALDSELTPAAVVLMAFLAGVWVVWATITDHNEWEAFKVQHECYVVAKSRGETFVVPVVGANGQVTVAVGSISSKTHWHCNDGVTYIR